LTISFSLLVAFASYLFAVDAAITITLAVTAFCVLAWVLEPIPIPVTALLPIAIFPLTGVLSASDVAEAYGSPIILLMLGGFLLSTAMAHSQTHEQIALRVLHKVGVDNNRRIVWGFMFCSAVLSMWISNTATALMLLPVALAVIDQLHSKTLAKPLLLGIAYAASVGGIGTPIGTPPNLIFMQVYKEFTGNEISFIQWMKIALPVVIVFIPLIALWVTRGLKQQQASSIKLPEFSPWSTQQKRILLVFFLTALCWITRTEPFGGWSTWLGLPMASDASVALLAVILLFIVRDDEKLPLLSWDSAKSIPWGILLLFAGGLTIAKAFIASGLSQLVGDYLQLAFVLPLLLVLFVLTLSVSFLTETTSNTASTSLLMPLLASAALAAGVEPELIMIPAAMSASCAFMLPVATAPNSIVFSSGHFSISAMAKEGLALNVLGAVVITVLCYLML
jgi:sodium-dependent dicarboxylate transporter 2/3/5